MFAFGCSDTERPRLDLELTRGADVRVPAHLVVFLKIGEGANYTVGAEAMDVVQAGYGPSAARLVFGVEAPAGVSGPVSVYVAGCRTPPVCTADLVASPVCRCDTFESFAAGTTEVYGYTRLSMALTAISAAQCDRDGDLIPDCGQGGVVSACCDHLPSAVRARIHDCHDRPGMGRGDPRTAHPFLPPERVYTVSPVGAEGALHRVYCGDGLDNDCRAEADVPCLVVDGDGDGVAVDEDCADDDPTRGPGFPEICGDGIDQDCDNADLLCDLDGDGYDVSVDCDEGNPAVNPGAVEVCGNGIDDDCRGGDLRCVVEDLDGDGYPCPDQSPQGTHECVGPGLDCDDRNAGAHPGREEVCGNDVDEDCDGVVAACPMNDADGDGYVSDRLGGVDCDDGDRLVHPGAAERCGNQVDEDCNGVMESCAEITDADGDGWADAVECDASRAEAYPGAEERCNGLDDDCDGVADEGNPEAGGLDAVGTCGVGCAPGVECSCEESVEVCGVRAGNRMPEVYCLAITPGELPELCDGFDQDCDGTLDNGVDPGPLLSLQAGVCAGQRQVCRGAQGWVDDPTIIGPYEATETRCDGLDNNCDGAVDLREGPGSSPLQMSCGRDEGECRQGVSLCEDGAFSDVCMGSVDVQRERCNGVDDDCDGDTDEDLDPPEADRQDGVCRGQRRECRRGDWREPDYNDIRGYENEERSCDGRDNDCDGQIDESLAAPEARRTEGLCEDLRQTCSGADGWTEPDYAQLDGYEADERTCDGLDNDCDGDVDEDSDRPCMIDGSQCPAVQECDGGRLMMCQLEDDGGREVCNGEDDDCDGETDEADDGPLCPREERCLSGRCGCPGEDGDACDETEVCREGVGCICAAAGRECDRREACSPEGCFCEPAGRVCPEGTLCRRMPGRCACPAANDRECMGDEICTAEGCVDGD